MIEVVNGLYERSSHFPLPALIRTVLLFNLMSYKHLSYLYRDLEASITNNNGLAARLGYEYRNMQFKIPSYSSLHHFLMYRVGDKGMQSIFNTAAMSLKQTAQSQGIIIGRYQAIDSTPHEATKRDTQADYNGHYKMCCYKEQRLICTGTSIPLSYCGSHATAYDGNYLQPLILQSRSNGFEGFEIWMDLHYATTLNIAFTAIEVDMKANYRINKRWKVSKQGTGSEIKRQYQKFWKDPGFIPADQCDLEHMLHFLYVHDREEQVGYYFRDSCIKQYKQEIVV